MTAQYQHKKIPLQLHQKGGFLKSTTQLVRLMNILVETRHVIYNKGMNVENEPRLHVNIAETKNQVYSLIYNRNISADIGF
jgi:hypothetical protein